MISKNEVRDIIRDSLGLEEKSDEELNESLVLQKKQFDLPTELLTDKNKKAHKGLYENYVKTFNTVSAELDGVEKDDANPVSYTHLTLPTKA